MMKKILVLLFLLLLTSCEKKHKHNINEEWECDSSSHWHECLECDDILDIVLHDYIEGANICSICGFQKKLQTEEFQQQYEEKVEIDGIRYKKITKIFLIDNQAHYQHTYYNDSNEIIISSYEIYDNETNILRHTSYSEEKEDGVYYESYHYDENGELINEEKKLNSIPYYSKRYMYGGEFHLTIAETHYDQEGNRLCETFTNYNIIGELVSIRKEEESKNEYDKRILCICRKDENIEVFDLDFITSS